MRALVLVSHLLIATAAALSIISPISYWQDGYELLTARPDEPVMDIGNCLKSVQRGL